MGDLRGFWKQGSASAWQQSRKAPGEKNPKKQKAKKRRYRHFAPKRKAGKDNDRFYLCEAWRRLRYQALKNSDGRCEACGASPRDGVQLHVDHIIPRSKCPKRELDITNLQVLCEDCNLGKGAWDQTDWRDRLDLRSGKPLGTVGQPQPNAAADQERPKVFEDRKGDTGCYPCGYPTQGQADHPANRGDRRDVDAYEGNGSAKESDHIPCGVVG